MSLFTFPLENPFLTLVLILIVRTILKIRWEWVNADEGQGTKPIRVESKKKEKKDPLVVIIGAGASGLAVKFERQNYVK